ncbi:hypothetical protein F4553_005155 [Allocatelliglobosispora scoriae]|uniref:Uncharacterized protein n=1 Tax=Allocatelliglobosispora scoriae TaxID=643052 RepID=A0A841BW97_9ACTN|nr:hypothetical protein [Allocatelliglobosispora scoriae]MBB5871776.1 hypothetical protein [Allocatelliglobosispora scoriae]
MAGGIGAVNTDVGSIASTGVAIDHSGASSNRNVLVTSVGRITVRTEPPLITTIRSGSPKGVTPARTAAFRVTTSNVALITR